MERYLDASLSPKERAEDLISKLTIDEKMAQVAGIFAGASDGKELAETLKYGIGQISTLSFTACPSAEAAAGWQRQLQKLVIENSPHHIPAIFHMEGICGAYVKGSTAFPSGVNRGATFDPELERKIGEIVSRQEAAYGITQVLAPVLDLARDPRMGRHSESYSEDPTLAGAMGAAFTRGIQETETDGRHPEAVAKHFLGFHSSMGGIHGAGVDAGERVMREIYAKPFQAAVREGSLKGVMPCYSSVNGMPIHASYDYLTGLLRNELGFEGVVVSDYGAIWNVYAVQHVGESTAEAGFICLEAGMDVELPIPFCYGEELKEKFRSGEADVAILDRAVMRVLEAKFRMGIFEHPYSLEGDALYAAIKGGEEISRAAAQESITLLKNNGILPITEEKPTVAVIGPHAGNARYYFGGYTHISMVESQHAAGNSMAGVGQGGDSSSLDMERVPGTNVQVDDTEEFDSILRSLEPKCKNLVEALREALPDANILYATGYPKAGADDSGFSEALALIEKADFAILTLGGKNGSGSVATMGEGVDGAFINLPACQDAFIRKAADMGKPLIGVHFDGRPISSDTADELLDAILEAWTPASFAAEAVVNVITGKYNPSGKLPVTVARSAGQIPVYYNHPNGSSWHQGMSVGFTDYVDMPHKPRYPFGFGLSYTNFVYSDLVIEQKEVSPVGTVSLSFKVANTGLYEGTEVVQLYLSDCQASMTRPVKELAGFQRVKLYPGEKKTIRFTISPTQMAFLGRDMRWKVEKGEFAIQIASSSEDIRLTDSFTVSETAFIEGRNRSLKAKSEIL